MRRSAKAVRIEPPDLPKVLDPAPAELEPSAEWDGLEADASVVVTDPVPDVKLREVLWSGGDLVGRTLRGFRARDTRFVRCDFSGAVLDGALLERVVFEQCRMTGVVFSNAMLRDVEVRESGLRLTNFRMAGLERVLVDESVLVGADLYESALRSCALVRSDLTGADFSSATIKGLDLHGSVLDQLGGTLSLRGARISSDQMVPLGAAILGAVGIEVTDREVVQLRER